MGAGAGSLFWLPLPAPANRLASPASVEKRLEAPPRAADDAAHVWLPVRVVCHAILRIDVVPARVRARDRRSVDAAKTEAQFVEFLRRLCKPKRRPEDYPALNYLRSAADVG